MIPSTILDEARTDTGTNVGTYSNTQGMVHFNFIYQDIISDIIAELWEDYFWNISKVDFTVVGQEEYSITTVGSGPSYRVNEVHKVFIKYSPDDQYYTRARRVNPTNLEFDMDYYKTNQSKLDPIYTVQDNSVFIYPAPTEVVAEGIKMNIIYQPNDLTISSVESDIVIAPRFHRTIVSGIKYKIYALKQMMNESQLAKADYDTAKLSMLRQMWQREKDLVQISSPNLNQYT